MLLVSSGRTVDVKVSVSPVYIVVSDLFSWIFSAYCLTVTWQVAVRSVPSWVVAVIVAVPALTPVTTPLPSTVAMVSSLDVQETALLLVSSGRTVDVRVSVSPVYKVVSVAGRDRVHKPGYENMGREMQGKADISRV